MSIDKIICAIAQLNRRVRKLEPNHVLLVINAKWSPDGFDFRPYQDHQTFMFVVEETTDPMTLLNDEYEILQWFKIKVNIIDSNVYH